MTAKEQIALALDEAGFVSTEDGFLDSLKSGFKKLMGGNKGVSGSGNGGENDMSIAEHDRKHHPHGFNPETDSCSWRENKIKNGGDPSLFKAPTGQFTHGGAGGGANARTESPRNDGSVGGDKNKTITLASGEQLTIVDGVLRVPSLGNIEIPVDQENVFGMATLLNQLEIAEQSPTMTDEQRATYEAVMEHLKENLKGGVEATPTSEGEGEKTTEGTSIKTSTSESTSTSTGAEGGELPQHVEKNDPRIGVPTPEMCDNWQMYDKNGDLVQYESQEAFDAAMVQHAKEIRGAVTQYDEMLAQMNESLKSIDDMLEKFAKDNGVEYQRQFGSFNSAILDAELEFTEAEGVDQLDSEQARDEWQKYKEAMQKKEYEKARKHRDKFNEIKDSVLEEQKKKALDEKFKIDDTREHGDGKPLDKNLLNKPLDITPDEESVMQAAEKVEDVLLNNQFAKGLLDAQELLDVRSGPTVSQFVFKVGEGHNFSKFGKNNVLSDPNIISAINGALGFNPNDKKNPRNAIVKLEGENVVVEVPNEQRKTVGLANLLENEGFKQAMESAKEKGKMICPIAISADNQNECFTWTLDDAANICFAGVTGAGKSVAFTSAIRALMTLYGPGEVGFMLADPKKVEFSEFEGAKHLEADVATDPIEIRSMVKSLKSENGRREQLLKDAGCKNIAEYNMKHPDKKLKHLILGIDELNTLVSELGNDFRDKDLATLMNVCRAQGIHVMWGTQTPSKEILGAQIVNNTGVRVGLRCESPEQSQQIIGKGHTECTGLMKNGDGYFYDGTKGTRLRMQAPFIPDAERARLTANGRGEAIPSHSEGVGEVNGMKVHVGSGGAEGTAAQRSSGGTSGNGESSGGGTSGGNGASSSAGTGGSMGESANGGAQKKETFAERKARKEKEAAVAKAKAEAEIQDKITRFASMKPEERIAEYDKEMNSEIAKAVSAEQERRGGGALSLADMALVAKPIQDKYAMLKQNEMANSESSSQKMTASEMAYKTAESEYAKNPTLDNRRKAIEAEKRAAMEKATTASELYQIEKKYNNVLKQIDADIAEENAARKQRLADYDAKKQKEAEKKLDTYQPMIEAYNAIKSEEGNTDEANMKYLDALKKHKLAILDGKNLSPEEDAEQRRAIREEYDKNAAPFKQNIVAKQAAAQKEKENKAKEEEAKRVQAEKNKAAQEKEAQRKAKEEEHAKSQAEKDKVAKAKADEAAKVKAESDKKAKRKEDARTAYEKEPTAANKQTIVEIDAEEAVERAKAKKYKTEAERAEAIKKVQEEEAEKVNVAKMDTETESLKNTMESMKALIEASKSKEGRESMSQQDKEAVGRVRRQFADNEEKKGKYQIEKMRKEGKHKDGSPYTEKDYVRDMRRLTRWSNWAHNTADGNAPFKRMFDPYTFDHAPTPKELMQEEIDIAEYGVVEDEEMLYGDNEMSAREIVLEQLKEAAVNE